MKAIQFRYGRDNLGYVIHGAAEAVVVDGGAVEPILDYLGKRGLTLTVVTNTHSHPDHTPGNTTLLEEAGTARFIPPEKAADMGRLTLEDGTVEVISTPGHTLDSVCFHGPGFLLSGDTLFIGKPGRCFSGRPDLLQRSVQQLMELPADTVLYPGHDYVLEYLEWCQSIEPGNPGIDAAIFRYDPTEVGSTLGAEKAVNPFLRLEEPGVLKALEERGLPAGTPGERWESLLRIM